MSRLATTLLMVAALVLAGCGPGFHRATPAGAAPSRSETPSGRRIACAARTVAYSA